MNDELISIIVPVYNVEKYLNRCVNSLINQTYKNIEILLIDDGSTDTSGEICDSYKKDERIKVWHKKNGGLSETRNYGLDKALGNVVCFIDSDDYVTLDMIEKLYTLKNKYNADVVVCGMRKFYNDKETIKFSKEGDVYTYTSDDALLKMIDYNSLVSPNAVNKMYDKKMFTNDCLYPIGKRYEDMGVTARIFSKSSIIIYTTSEMYMYFQRNDSITNESFNEKDLDHITMSEELYHYICNNRSKLKNEFLVYLIFSFVSCSNKIIMSNTNEYNYVIENACSLIKKNKKIILESRVYSIKKKVQLIMFAYLNKLYKMLYKRKAKKKYE